MASQPLLPVRPWACSLLHNQRYAIQGGGTGTYDEWDRKLVESLQRELGDTIEIHYPRMPNEGDPSFDAWRGSLEQAIGALRDGAILVGHSVGGTILTKLLVEQPFSQRLAGVYLLAAPFIGEGGWPADGMSFPPDFGARLPQDISIGSPPKLLQEESGKEMDTASSERYG